MRARTHRTLAIIVIAFAAIVFFVPADPPTTARDAAAVERKLRQIEMTLEMIKLIEEQRAARAAAKCPPEARR
jgi:hypothetical protein